MGAWWTKNKTNVLGVFSILWTIVGALGFISAQLYAEITGVLVGLGLIAAKSTGVTGGTVSDTGTGLNGKMLPPSTPPGS